jgi:hypothetical protein
MLAHAVEMLSLTVLYGLFCGQVVDTWLNGSIFDRLRMFFEKLKAYRVIGLIGELALCPRCSMHWVAALATAHFLYVTDVQIVWVPVIWLAIVGAGQWVYRHLTENVDPLMQAARMNDLERDDYV